MEIDLIFPVLKETQRNFAIMSEIEKYFEYLDKNCKKKDILKNGTKNRKITCKRESLSDML